MILSILIRFIKAVLHAAYVALIHSIVFALFLTVFRNIYKTLEADISAFHADAESVGDSFKRIFSAL